MHTERRKGLKEAPITHPARQCDRSKDTALTRTDQGLELVQLKAAKLSTKLASKTKLMSLPSTTCYQGRHSPRAAKPTFVKVSPWHSR